MASVFKALSDKTRREILGLLKDGPLPAGEIAGRFPFSKPTMSAHLSVLKEAGLVHSERKGQRVIYHLRISVLEDALLGFAGQFGIGAGERNDPDTPESKEKTE